MKTYLDLYVVFNLNFCKERPSQFIQERGKVNSFPVSIYHLNTLLKEWKLFERTLKNATLQMLRSRGVFDIFYTFFLNLISFENILNIARTHTIV